MKKYILFTIILLVSIFVFSCKKQTGTTLSDNQSLTIHTTSSNKLYTNFHSEIEDGSIFYNDTNKIYIVQINYANYQGTKLKTYIEFKKNKTKYNQDSVIPEEKMNSYASNLVIAGNNTCKTDIYISYKENSDSLIVSVNIKITVELFVKKETNLGFTSKIINVYFETKTEYNLDKNGYSITTLPKEEK